MVDIFKCIYEIRNVCTEAVDALMIRVIILDIF